MFERNIHLYLVEQKKSGVVTTRKFAKSIIPPVSKSALAL